MIAQGGIMARIKPIELFDHFNPQLRAALDEALARALPDAEIDKRMLYLEFRLALNKKVKPWENVPNSAVDAD
jgi:hypothetical protein